MSAWSLWLIMAWQFLEVTHEQCGLCQSLERETSQRKFTFPHSLRVCRDATHVRLNGWVKICTSVTRDVVLCCFVWLNRYWVIVTVPFWVFGLWYRHTASTTITSGTHALLCHHTASTLIPSGTHWTWICVFKTWHLGFEEQKRWKMKKNTIIPYPRG